MESHLLRSKIVCPDYHRHYPNITHGTGNYLFDDQGNKYLDASAGSCAVNLIGHGDPGIVQALAEQSQKVCILPAHYMSSNVVLDYLKKLCEFSGFGRRAWTCSSGSEAVENALKVALQYHMIRGDAKRYKIIGRENAYHGGSIFTLDVGGMSLRRGMFKPLLNDFAHAKAAYPYRCPDNQSQESYNLDCAESLRRCIEEEGPDTVAAFVCEPVVGAALGGVEPDPLYFERIRNICDEYGILLVVDEVMSGMCRTGKNFAIEHFNVQPDILAAGKGIGGGYYPLSAVIVNQRVADVFADNNEAFYGGHTHACSPQGAAIGTYVLDYLATHQINQKISEDGAYLRERLESLYQYPIVGNVRGIGFMAGIELVANKDTKEPFDHELMLSAQLGERLLERHIILYPGRGSVDGLRGDHILITPPLTLTREDIDLMVDALDAVIAEACEWIFAEQSMK